MKAFLQLNHFFTAVYRFFRNVIFSRTWHNFHLVRVYKIRSLNSDYSILRWILIVINTLKLSWSTQMIYWDKYWCKQYVSVTKQASQYSSSQNSEFCLKMRGVVIEISIKVSFCINGCHLYSNIYLTILVE